MKIFRLLGIFLILGLLGTQCLATESIAKVGMMASKDANVKAQVKPAEAWYPSGEPRGDKGALWEQGTSMQELNRKRTLQKTTANTKQQTGVHTQAGADSQLKQIAEYERNLKDKPITIGKTTIRGESIVDESTWRPAVTEPVKIDETILNSQRNVVGAYANMVEDGNFTMSAGPELHLQESIDTPLDDDGPPQGSEVGMGMKFKWDF